MRTDEIDDTEFHETTLKEVRVESDGFAVTGDDGWSFFLPKHTTVTPAAGDTMRLYGRGIGFTVRGAAVNGEVFFYRTESEEKAKHEQWCADEKAKKQADYEANRSDYERRVALLPEQLQKRFAKFAAAKADWWPEFGPYELFCCEQAVAFAAEFPSDPNGLKAWTKLSWDEQKKAVPALSSEHSGNTFGMAARLAYHLLTQPNNAEREHGALVQLVGCKDYGCTHEAAP